MKQINYRQGDKYMPILEVSDDNRIVNVTDPVDNQDVATKNYIDIYLKDIIEKQNALSGGVTYYSAVYPNADDTDKYTVVIGQGTAPMFFEGQNVIQSWPRLYDTQYEYPVWNVDDTYRAKIVKFVVNNYVAPAMMGSFFYSCSALADIVGIDKILTSKSHDFFNTFYKCSSLTSLDLSSWDTSVTTTMSQMFADCTSLQSINVSTWDTRNVTTMNSMFNNCTSLQSLDITNFSTGNVTAMDSMFNYCQSLTVLDLSSFNTWNLLDISSMFVGCSNLRTIYATKAFTTAKIENSNTWVFNGCTNLVGGNGTKFVISQYTVEYARIDTDSTPGYFTQKP